jgi:hypothetical protein
MGETVMDAVYIGISIAFFAITWGILKMCDILQKDGSGGGS